MDLYSLYWRFARALGAVSAMIFAFPVDAQSGSATVPRSGPARGLTADSVIAIVLSTNPRAGAAAELIRAARGTRRTAGTWTNPTLSYQVENTAFPGQGPLTGVDREASTVAMIPLEPAYQLRSRASRASAEVRVATAEFSGVRRTLAIQAASAFYGAALADVSVNALDDARAWLDSLTRYMGARVREGAAAEVDLIRLEVERDRAETDLALARVDQARMRALLASLIGRDDFTVDVTDMADSTSLRRPIPDLRSALTSALKSRPEIAASDARLAAASSGVAVERSSIVRELGLITGLKSMAGTQSMIAGLSVSLPVFDQNRGGIQRARAEQRIAGFNSQNIKREVVADVTATWTATQTLSAQLSRMQGGMLRRAEEARRIAEAAYREGATPLTQVIEASRALADARQLYFRALFARAQSLVELDATIGGER